MPRVLPTPLLFPSLPCTLTPPVHSPIRYVDLPCEKAGRPFFFFFFFASIRFHRPPFFPLSSPPLPHSPFDLSPVASLVLLFFPSSLFPASLAPSAFPRSRQELRFLPSQRLSAPSNRKPSQSLAPPLAQAPKLCEGGDRQDTTTGAKGDCKGGREGGVCGAATGGRGAEGGTGGGGENAPSSQVECDTIAARFPSGVEAEVSSFLHTRLAVGLKAPTHKSNRILLKKCKRKAKKRKEDQQKE